MLVEVFCSDRNVLVFPLTIVANGGEQGQNANLALLVRNQLSYALIYVGF